MKRFAWALLVITLAFASYANAQGYTLFGDASYISPGHNSNRAVYLVSNTSDADTSNDYSGIDFTVPAGTTYSQITNLATDYFFVNNSCGGGSPRFQVNVTTGSGTKNVFVYIGPPPNYTLCPTGVWVSTGNLMTPASLVDDTQLGGTFYDPLPASQAAYGTLPVTGIQLVDDGGWIFPNGLQNLYVDNVQINTTTYTFEFSSKDDCKNGGWKNFVFAPGPFKNQGDCVSYFATGGRNLGSGQ